MTSKKTGIHIKKSKQGSLHADLGVPTNTKIPEHKLMAAKNSKSSALRKKANFAINAKKWKH